MSKLPHIPIMGDMTVYSSKISTPFVSVRSVLQEFSSDALLIANESNWKPYDKILI